MELKLIKNTKKSLSLTKFSDYSLPQDHHDRTPAFAAPLRLPLDHPLQRVPLHQVDVHDCSLQTVTSARGFCHTLVRYFYDALQVGSE